MCGFEVAVGGHDHLHGGHDGHHLGGLKHEYGDGHLGDGHHIGGQDHSHGRQDGHLGDHLGGHDHSHGGKDIGHLGDGRLLGGHDHSHGGQVGQLDDHQHLGGHAFGDGGQHFNFGHQFHSQSDGKATFHEDGKKFNNLSWKQFIAGDLLGLDPHPHQQHEGRHQQEGNWDDLKSDHEDFGQSYEMSNIQSLDNDSDMGQTDLKGSHDGQHYHNGHAHVDDIDDQRNEGQSLAVIGQSVRPDEREHFFDYDLL